MSCRGNCWDNAVMEYFYSCLKVELIYAEQYCSIDEVRSSIFEYIEFFYNRLCRHSALSYVSVADRDQARELRRQRMSKRLDRNISIDESTTSNKQINHD